jgi:hypothetical protein
MVAPDTNLNVGRLLHGCNLTEETLSRKKKKREKRTRSGEKL